MEVGEELSYFHAVGRVVVVERLSRKHIRVDDLGAFLGL